jgi:hypothetical protein
MRRRKLSSVFVRHLDVADCSVSDLSEQAWLGLGHAQQLAADARMRSSMNLRQYEPSWPPVTVEEMADQEGVHVVTIRRRIAAARRELFGEISDDAIFKRTRRQEQRTLRPRRKCGQKGCTADLPAGAPKKRNYCDAHRSSAARTRRYRQSATV